MNKSAPSSQNCPKVDAVHMRDYDNPEDDAGSLRGEAYGHLLDKRTVDNHVPTKKRPRDTSPKAQSSAAKGSL